MTRGGEGGLVGGGGAEGLIKATKHETVARHHRSGGDAQRIECLFSARSDPAQALGVKGHRRKGGVVLRCFGGVTVGAGRVRSVIK